MLRLLVLLLTIFTPLDLAFGQSSLPLAAAWPSSAGPLVDSRADEGAQTGTDGRSVSWKEIVPNILEDQKSIYWDYPRALVAGKHWLPTTVFLAGIGTLIASDQFETPYFRHTSSYHGFNTGFSGTNTSLMIAAAPAATYLLGLLRKDRYSESTALLAAEAVADSEISAEILKVTTRRARPESIPMKGNFADTWQDSRTVTGGGFPSGHTIAAFSVATVMSRRFGESHHWLPYVSYGLASTIGFSRITLSAHNVSDVAAGAALGYVISRFVVLRDHKFK